MCSDCGNNNNENNDNQLRIFALEFSIGRSIGNRYTDCRVSTVTLESFFFRICRSLFGKDFGNCENTIFFLDK